MTDGPVPYDEMPDTPSQVAAVLGSHAKAISNLEHASATVHGLLRETSNHVLTVLGEVRSMGGKLDAHIGDSVSRARSLDGRVKAIEKIEDQRTGGERVEASLKTNWVVPLGRTAIGAVLIAGLVGLVSVVVVRVSPSRVDQETIRQIIKAQAAVKDVP